MSKETEDLVRSLYRLGLVQREIARHTLAELGSQGFTALAGIRADGPMRVSDVANRLSINISVASRQVNALLSAGYVQQEPDQDDRRAHLITVTEEGERVLVECHSRLVEAFAEALEDWSPDQIAELAGRLDALRADFSRHRGHAEVPGKKGATR
jgi:DNA-binding MarR family transcriptional regulator